MLRIWPSDILSHTHLEHLEVESVCAQECQYLNIEPKSKYKSVHVVLLFEYVNKWGYI